MASTVETRKSEIAMAYVPMSDAEGVTLTDTEGEHFGMDTIKATQRKVAIRVPTPSVNER